MLEHSQSSPAPYALAAGTKNVAFEKGGPVHDMKRMLKRMAAAAGFQVIRKQPNRADFFASRAIDTVVDVGANIGQFGREIRAEGFGGRIVSFEPIPEVHRVLVENSGADPQWLSYNFGLSDRPGTAAINVSGKSVFSSLQTARKAALEFDADAAAICQQQIELRRLEEFDEKIGGARLFLKIDTQGHERKVLQGIGSLARRLYGIQLELPISMLYEGTWTISEAMAFMRDIGFIPTYFSPVNYHDKHDPIAIVEIDCIFRRIDPEID